MNKILVVDDDKAFLQMVVTLLGDAGFQVGAANSGQSALRQLADDGPWDLVLCDILMPEQDGIETIQAILKANNTQKIIAMSGGGHYLPSYSALELAQAFGFVETIFKPFHEKQLLVLIDKILKS
ncbi:MAG: response regulator [Magnetococcales bacterium]|nr:response regulator [Magnetococcales bacterium]